MVDVPTDLLTRSKGSPFVVEWQLASPPPVDRAGSEEPIVTKAHPRREPGEVPSTS